MKTIRNILLIFLVLVLAASSVKLLSNSKGSVTPLHKNEVNVDSDKNEDPSELAFQEIRAKAIALRLTYPEKHFLTFEGDAVTTGISWDNGTGQFVCTKFNEGGGAFAVIPQGLRSSRLVVKVDIEELNVGFDCIKVDLYGEKTEDIRHYYLSDFTYEEPYYDEEGNGIAGSEHLEGGLLTVDMSALPFVPQVVYVHNLGIEDDIYGDDAITFGVYLESDISITNESTPEQVASAVEFIRARANDKAAELALEDIRSKLIEMGFSVNYASTPAQISNVINSISDYRNRTITFYKDGDAVKVRVGSGSGRMSLPNGYYGGNTIEFDESITNQYDGASMGTMTVDGVTFNFIKGMTWRQLCESTFGRGYLVLVGDSAGFISDGSGIEENACGNVATDDGSDYLDADTVIVDGKAYTTTT